jgi:hypothetical protein
MTDAEFEKLDAKAWRYLECGRRIPYKLAGRLVACRDCDRADPEFYMLKNYLWRSAIPSGRGCLCLACLAKRLCRPLVAADFGTSPDETTQ